MTHTKNAQDAIIADINGKVSEVLELIKEPLNEVVGAFSQRTASFYRSKVETELKSHGKPRHTFENTTHGYESSTYTIGESDLQNIQALHGNFTKSMNKFRKMMESETRQFSECIKKLYQNTYTAYFSRPNPEVDNFQAVRERLDTLVYVLTDEFINGVIQTLNVILEAEDHDKMVNDATELFRGIMHDVHEQLSDIDTAQKGFTTKTVLLRQN
jgi:hypothetical protein